MVEGLRIRSLSGVSEIFPRCQVAVTALVVVLWEFKAVFYAVWSPFVWLVGYNDPRKPSDDLLHGEPLILSPIQ